MQRLAFVCRPACRKTKTQYDPLVSCEKCHSSSQRLHQHLMWHSHAAGRAGNKKTQHFPLVS